MKESVKGAVCNLTVLKHKNTTICLQICVRMSDFCFGLCDLAHCPIYPIVFEHPWLPIDGKHMEARKQTG